MKLHKGERGSPFHEKNRVKTDIKSLKTIYRAIDLFKEGLPRALVTEIITNEKLITPTDVGELVGLGLRVIEDEFASDDQTTIGLHLTRYNKDIDDLLFIAENDYADGSMIKYKINTYLTVLEIMFAKEKLLQLHNRNTILKINQRNTTIVQKETQPKYKLGKLSLEERIELLQLINKSKSIDGDDIKSITETQQEEYVEFTELKGTQEGANVEKIEKVTPVVEGERIPGGALLDVRERLRQSLERKAQEEYRKIGSKTPDLQDTE